jgi:hypothetical protein
MLTNLLVGAQLETQSNLTIINSTVKLQRIGVLPGLKIKSKIASSETIAAIPKI